jgi:hypothetical protein
MRVDEETPDVENELDGDFEHIDEPTLAVIDNMLLDLYKDVSLETNADLPRDFNLNKMWLSVAYDRFQTDFHREANALVARLKAQHRTDSFVRKHTRSSRN